MTSVEEQTILITGGTGFAGSHLVEHLLSLGVQSEKIFVTHLDSVPSFLKKLLPESQYIRLDLTEGPATKEAFEKIKPSWIFHLASIATVGDSYEKSEFILSHNLKLQLAVLEAYRDISPNARFLSVGSADSYGLSLSEDELPIAEEHPFRPVNPYAVSKISQEMLSYSYHKSYSLDIVRVRPFNHIGERQSPAFSIPAFARQIVAIERNEQSQLQVGNLTATRDFTDVKDMVKAYVTVMEKGESGDVYNIGSGTGVVMAELLDQLSAMAKATIERVEDADRLRPLDIPIIIANNTKIKELGWKPEIPLSETLSRVLTYWRAQ